MLWGVGAAAAAAAAAAAVVVVVAAAVVVVAAAAAGPQLWTQLPHLEDHNFVSVATSRFARIPR